MTIEIRGLRKYYSGLAVIDGLDLQLPERGIVGLSGPSGCGKTTFLNLLAGLQKPDQGEITGLADGEISMVFQEDRLLPWVSTLENIALVARDHQSAAEWLDKMQLNDFGDAYPSELSGGMKRRVALARALAFESKLLLLDEPFLGMDLELKQSIYGLIRETGQSRLVILVTHDAADLLELADQILIADGPPLMIETIDREVYRTMNEP